MTNRLFVFIGAAVTTADQRKEREYIFIFILLHIETFLKSDNYK